MPGSKVSNVPENNSFATSFMHLKLRREHREDCMGVEEKWGLYYRIVKDIICFLEGAYFKGVLT